MKKAQLFIVFTGFLLIVFGFQNCSAPLPEEEGSLASTNAEVNFAFNTEIDQLAYMSCHQLGTNFDRSTYFTFRVGAYRPGYGVGFTPKFLQTLAGLPQDRWRSSIVDDPVAKDAQPLLSVRDPQNAQSIYLPASSGPTAGFDHSKMMGVLTSDALADEFLKNVNNRVRYKRAAAAEGMRLEGDLNLNFGTSGIANLHGAFNNGAILAINYPVRSTNVITLRSPATYSTGYASDSSSTQVFGKGLELNFQRHPSNPNSGPNWALSAVHEHSMERPLYDSSRVNRNMMSCPSSLIFKVVDRRHLTPDPNNTDTSKIYCEMKPDHPAALSPGDQELLRRARLSLRVEDWYIDWSRKCIVPKKVASVSSQNHCYGSSSSTVPVEYDLTKQCFEGPTTGARACVALASICIR